MKKGIIIGTVLLLLLIFFKFGKSNQPEQKSLEQVTEVIDYKQEYVPETKKEGSCWTTSIAAQSNVRAWRCRVENMIYDPCFETDDGEVVCGVDPENSKSGFELILTEKFPEGLSHNPKEDIWVSKLENGLVCSSITGTAGEVNGESYFYSCNNNAVLLGDFGKTFDKSQGLWKVKVVYLDKNWEQIGQTEILDVLRVWE